VRSPLVVTTRRRGLHPNRTSFVVQAGASWEQLRCEGLRTGRSHSCGGNDADMATARGERPDHSTSRRIVVGALLVLGSVLSVATIAGVWTRTLLLDTDRYVETVAPLATDVNVRETATRRVVDALMNSVDVEAMAADALPEGAASFAPAIAAGTRVVVDDATRAFFASSTFGELWDDANRVAHRQVVRLLTGEGEVVRVQDGVVVIDLAAIAEQIRVRLVDGGLTLLDDVPISEIRAQLEVMEADELVAVQDGVDLVRMLAWWLPLGVVASFGAAVYLSPDRRAGVRNVGLALASSMVVLAAAFGVGRRVYLDAVDGLLDPAAAEATFDILTRYVRQGVRFVLAVGLSMVVGAWLSGPSDSALRIRGAVRRSTDRTGRTFRGEGDAAGPVISWVANHRRGLQTGLLSVIGVVVVTLDHPSVGALLIAILGGAIGWVLIETIASSVRSVSEGTVEGTVGDALG
jgi:hypothetical protein